jgi:hypothetical protein
MFPCAVAAVAARLTTLSVVDVTTSVDSPTITGSASIIAEDILVFFDCVWNILAPPPASSVPTDFVQISTATIGLNDDSRGTLSYKKATGAEASTSLTGMSGTGGATKILYVFRGDDPATTITVADPGQEATDGNPSPQTITAGSGTPPLLVIGAYCTSASALDPRTFTVGGSPAKDGETVADGSSIISYLAYKIFNISPSDVVIDMDDESVDNILMSCYLQIS